MKKNESGFTLLEVIIVLSIAGTFFFIIVEFFQQANKSIKNIESKLENELDESSGDLIVEKDISNSILSFNQIKNSISPNFFKYYSSPPPKNCKNKAVLRLQNPGDELFFILINRSPRMSCNNMALSKHTNNRWHYCLRMLEGKWGIYPYSDFYKYNSVTDFVNNTPKLMGIGGMNAYKDSNGKRHPIIETPGLLLGLLIPYNFKKLGSSNQCSVGRWSIFVGYTSRPSAGKPPVYITHIKNKLPQHYKNIFKNFHQQNGKSFNNVNKFLKVMPHIGGMAPLVFITPIQLVRYFIHQDIINGKTVKQLKRKVIHTLPNGYHTANAASPLSTDMLNDSSSIVYHDIEKVVLKRPNLETMVIEVEPHYKSIF